jgi:PIN domain nuclease of toxin-antitoxin system
MGKLTLTLPYRQWISQAINDLQATILPITIEYADCQAKLPCHHRDPFDRLLIAQSLVEDIPLVSSEALFDQYGIKRNW